MFFIGKIRKRREKKRQETLEVINFIIDYLGEIKFLEKIDRVYLMSKNSRFEDVMKTTYRNRILKRSVNKSLEESKTICTKFRTILESPDKRMLGISSLHKEFEDLFINKKDELKKFFEKLFPILWTALLQYLL